MQNKPAQIHEKNNKRYERIDTFIAREFIASNMSDAKWIKALSVVSRFAECVPRIKFKLVNEDSTRQTYNESDDVFVETQFFREPIFYKELEWVEFPYVMGPNDVRETIKNLQIALNVAGQFPLHESDSGLRIVAYVRA